MSSITAHFGLGQDTQIDLITVCWPSGNVTTLENVAVNTTLNIVEVDGNVNGVEAILAEEFNVYPNPTSDFLNISSEMNLNNFPIEIIDLKGSVVLSTMIKDNRIDLGNITTGTYFARINANGIFHQVTFVKE